MRTKLQIIHRIKLLYYIFFIMIIASVVVGITGRDFQAGFKAGAKTGTEYKCGDPEKKLHTTHFISIENDISNQAFNIPILQFKDGSLSVKGRINTIDLEVQSENPLQLSAFPKVLSAVLILLSALTYAAIFIVIFLILNSLRRSIKSNDLFSRHNITLTRCIGILLIAASVMGDIGIYIDNCMAARMLEGSQFAPYVGFPLTFRDLIMGVLILFIAEIFAIGYDMTEEQRLTI